MPIKKAMIPKVIFSRLPTALVGLGVSLFNDWKIKEYKKYNTWPAQPFSCPFGAFPA